MLVPKLYLGLFGITAESSGLYAPGDGMSVIECLALCVLLEPVPITQAGAFILSTNVSVE